MVQKTIGLVLKEQRTQLDWTLDVAEARTSIRKIYISALETGNYGALPGPFYVRAYLKQYATRLDLDVAAILTAYDAGTMLEVEGPIEDTGNYRFVRPDERVPERPVEADGELIDGEKAQGAFRRHFPMIALSAVAVVILASVAAIILLNRPTGGSLATDDYTVSSSRPTHSSSQPETILSSSQSGSVMILTVTSHKNPVTLDFKLNTGAAATNVNLSAANVQALTLSPDNRTASATLDQSAGAASVSFGIAGTIAMTVNGKSVALPASAGISRISLQISYPGDHSAPASSTSSVASSTAQVASTAQAAPSSSPVAPPPASPVAPPSAATPGTQGNTNTP